MQLPAGQKLKSFRRRSGTDPLAVVPEDEELSRQPSLDWDKYGENAPLQIVWPLDNTRTWSTDTLFSAPIASSSALDGSESSDSENYLSPDA